MKFAMAASIACMFMIAGVFVVYEVPPVPAFAVRTMRVKKWHNGGMKLSVLFHMSPQLSVYKDEIQGRMLQVRFSPGFAGTSPATVLASSPSPISDNSGLDPATSGGGECVAEFNMNREEFAPCRKYGMRIWLESFVPYTLGSGVVSEAVTINVDNLQDLDETGVLVVR